MQTQLLQKNLLYEKVLWRSKKGCNINNQLLEKGNVSLTDEEIESRTHHPLD